MRTHLDQALGLLGRELFDVNAGDEYAIFGSTTLVLRGVVDRGVGDVDVMVTRRVWGALLARPGWDVLTPNAGDPPILVREAATPLHLFYDWNDVALWMNPAVVIAEADVVEGFRCASLQEVLRHKREVIAWLDTPPQNKHRPDAIAIEAFMREGVAA